MQSFCFTKGADVVLKADGVVLGGVSRAVIDEKNSAYKIEEYLCGEPVARLADITYEITLTFHSGSPRDFENGLPVELVFEEKNRTVKFSDCTMSTLKSVLTPVNAVEYTAVFESKKRSVAYGS